MKSTLKELFHLGELMFGIVLLGLTVGAGVCINPIFFLGIPLGVVLFIHGFQSI